jgi:uncharacterized membrane protein YkvA (DUF1232 family)
MAVMARLLDWARRLKRDAVALWFAARDPRTPWPVRVFLWLVVAYALSPIDLIPDFIPVLGYLDEALLLPAAVWLALRLVPAPVIADGRARAAALTSKPSLRTGAVIIVAIWIVAALWLLRTFTDTP